MDIGALFASPFFVGAAGALVGIRFYDAKWWQRALNLVYGALIGGYISQPVADWLKLTKESDLLGVAFALGLLGLSVVAAILKGIGDLKVADIVSGWISRRG